MDLKALGEWLSGEVDVALHVSFWIAVAAVAFVVWRAMQWRYDGIIERLRDERDSLSRRQHHPHTEPPAPAEQPGASLPSAASLLAAMRHPYTPPSKRVFVGKKVTPESLMRSLKGKTYAQAKKLAEPFIGKWIRATAIVKDVYPTADSEHVWGKTEDDSGSLSLTFAESEWSRVEALTIEESITLIGSIKELNQYEMRLYECEFTDNAA